MTITPPGPLDYERHALRFTLQRVLREDRNLASLCKNVPRLATAAANVVRTDAAARGKSIPNQSDAIRKAIEDLLDEYANEEE